MKFAAYVTWILLCKRDKFGEKIPYNSRDIKFFLGDYFLLGHPVHTIACMPSCVKTGKEWCNKRTTKLYCHFIAADSIVDAISFIISSAIVLWSENMFSSNMDSQIW